MAQIRGFWSYVHANDQAEGGRITRLHKDLTAEFELLTGDTIDLFVDRNGMQWGDQWQDKLDRIIEAGSFFIPVLTPQYFQSAQCRSELQKFAMRATQMGAKELLLPLLYADVSALHDEHPADDLMKIVKDFHWEDWTDLRYTEPTSEAYRRGVGRLADRLVKANTQAERFPVNGGEERALDFTPAEPDEAPGTLDLVDAAEEAMPQWANTMGAIGEEAEALGNDIRETMAQANQSIERADLQGKGTKARLLAMRRVAQVVGPRSERILELSSQFTSQLYAVDAGTRVAISSVAQEYKDDPAKKDSVCEFYATVRQAAEAIAEMTEAISMTLDEIAPAADLSRELRPPLRQLRQGFTALMEAKGVSDAWVRLIDESEVDCD